MRSSIYRLACLVVFALLSACSASTPLVIEKLDPRTGVTVRSAAQPLILYRDNSAYAAHARDYVYLGPVEVNNMGARSYFLWLGIWGTMTDDARLSSTRDGFDAIVLYADGEPLPLELAGWTPSAVGTSEPVYTKPVAGAADAYYRVTADQIRLISMAQDIMIRTVSRNASTYTLWDEQARPAAAWQSFARSTYD